MPAQLPRVFVGSSSESLRLAEAVQANLEGCADVRIWNQGLFQSGNSALEDLIRMCHDYDFATFIFSGDDMTDSRGISSLSPRDNVVLEAGMFYGVLGRERVFLILPASEGPKMPTDLLGITQLRYRMPADKNYVAALGPATRQIADRIANQGVRKRVLPEVTLGDPRVFGNVHDAWPSMKNDAYTAETVAIMGIRGLSAFGTDQSLVSLAEIERFQRLRKLRILLMGDESAWISPGNIRTRNHESVEVFKKELRMSHEIMESAMGKLSQRLGTATSGVRYYTEEPKFGMVITDKVAYVNSYAEDPLTQVVDLSIYRFEKSHGSLYRAFKRHFDEIWHNRSAAGSYQQKFIDLETSAGGIVIAGQNGDKYVALLRRDDGYWVLPKGHRKREESLEEAARREVAEETGLTRDSFYIERSLGYYSYDETAERLNVAKVTHLYLMRCHEGTKPELMPSEFPEGAWWDLRAPLPEMLYAYQRSYLHEVIESERGRR